MAIESLLNSAILAVERVRIITMKRMLINATQAEELRVAIEVLTTFVAVIQSEVAG